MFQLMYCVASKSNSRIDVMCVPVCKYGTPSQPTASGLNVVKSLKQNTANLVAFYTVSQKRRHYIVVHIFARSQPSTLQDLGSDARSGLPEKVKDMNELRERLVEVWIGLQQNVIDDAIDQWPDACVPAFGLEKDILSMLWVTALAT